jgi:peptidoglycan/xylan/chitin deacetylase (PgdA/CDA1 family)
MRSFNFNSLRFTSTHNRFVTGTSCAALLLSTASCNRGEPEAEAPKPVAAPTRISDADLAKHKPNEAGAVMVVMYHRISADEADNDLNRKPETFRKDLELLRTKNYHPVTALEFVENKMDVPAGKTPVVITFDDALPTQFHIKTDASGKAVIDRDCAVGIMQKFHEKHPDWPTKATFFVLPKEGRNSDPFGQSESVGDKFAFLIKNGYEIANHSATHANMHGMSAAEVSRELALARRSIQGIAPEAPMQTLALPYGKVPRDNSARLALVSGTNGGTSYANKGVFLAAWRPNLSPITRNDKSASEGGKMNVFDPARLERVKADAKAAKEPGTFEYWIKYFDTNPGLRYVSDGNMKIVAVPAARQSTVDAARVRSQGKILQIYGGAAASSGSKSGGAGLSVE